VNILGGSFRLSPTRQHKHYLQIDTVYKSRNTFQPFSNSTLKKTFIPEHNPFSQTLFAPPASPPHSTGSLPASPPSPASPPPSTGKSTDLCDSAREADARWARVSAPAGGTVLARRPSSSGSTAVRAEPPLVAVLAQASSVSRQRPTSRRQARYCLLFSQVPL
jgi:hypothetical protein